MGFVGDLLMYKIKRSDQMDDLRKMQQGLSQPQQMVNAGKQAVSNAIWGGGLDQMQPGQAPTLGQMAQQRFMSGSGGAPAISPMADSSNPLAATGQMAQGYRPAGVMGQSQPGFGFNPSTFPLNPTTAPMFQQFMNTQMSSNIGNQGAMDRQIQGQQFKADVEMPFNRETQLQLQQSRNAQSAINQQAGWGSPKEIQARETGLRKEYQAQAQPLESSLNRFETTTETLKQRGGDFNKLSSTDKLAMVKDFAKVLLPQEAVMSGDETAIAQSAAGTFGGSVDQWVNYLGGKGNIPASVAADMYKTMQSRVGNIQQDLAGKQQQYTYLANQYGLNASRVVGQQIYQMGEQQATTAPGSTPVAAAPVDASGVKTTGGGGGGANIPTDLQPVEPSLFGKPEERGSGSYWSW